MLKHQTLDAFLFLMTGHFSSVVIQAGLCWTLRVLQVSDHHSSKRSYSCWREAFLLSCLGSFLSLCREVSYLASFITVLFIFTDSPHLRLNPNSKYPNTYVNILCPLIVKGHSQGIILSTSEKTDPGHLELATPKSVSVSEKSAVYFQLLFNLAEC